MVVEKALEKDPADRYQSMRDLVVDLRRVARPRPFDSPERSLAHGGPESSGSVSRAASAPPAQAPPSPPVGRRWSGGAGGRAAGWFLKQTMVGQPPARDVQVRRLTDLVDSRKPLALSPDGRTVAFVATAGDVGRSGCVSSQGALRCN